MPDRTPKTEADTLLRLLYNEQEIVNYRHILEWERMNKRQIMYDREELRKFAEIDALTRNKS